MIRTAPLPAAVLDLALQTLPDDVKAGMRAVGPRAVLAGGYLRSLATQVYPGEFRSFVEKAPKDIDIFVPDADAMAQLASFVAPGRRCVGYQRYLGGMPTWRKTVTFKERAGETAEVQVIAEWAFESAVEVIENFDFSVSAAALWWNGSDWEGVTEDWWEKEISQRLTSYRSTAPNPAGTLLRLPRYLSLGYHVPNESLTCIAARATEQAQDWYQRRGTCRGSWREGQPGYKLDLGDVMFEMCEKELISPPSTGLVRTWEGTQLIPQCGEA